MFSLEDVSVRQSHENVEIIQTSNIPYQVKTYPPNPKGKINFETVAHLSCHVSKKIS